jgi:hypothetical protein
VAADSATNAILFMGFLMSKTRRLCGVVVAGAYAAACRPKSRLPRM